MTAVGRTPRPAGPPSRADSPDHPEGPPSRAREWPGPGRICLALDGTDTEASLAVAAATEAHVGVFKVGLSAFVSAGPELITRLAPRRPVFADLKAHDIPDQVGHAAAALSRIGASYMTVHAAGGRAMIAAAVGAAGLDLKILAVTVLTSLDAKELERVGMTGSPLEAVVRLAETALQAGAPGLVCSPLEVGALRERFGPSDGGGPLLVVPGIRVQGAPAGDQRRTLGPREAVALGADLIVVGRPITAAPDPAAAARTMAAELAVV